MESGLQLFYAAMSIYGWWQWQPGGEKKEALVISRWSLKQHLLTFSVVIFLSLLSCIYLNSNTQAAYPFFDSIVTWGSLITTYMVTQKILENWLYWVILDFVALCLYLKQGLYLTSGLFVIFVIIALLGQIRWLKKFCAEVSESKLSPTLT
jgi:nicotinamide mononucleotide transporter